MRQLKRKEFLFFLPLLLGAGTIWLWGKAVKREMKLQNRRKRIYYPSTSGPFVRMDEVVFVKMNHGLTAFHGRCTHLGCKLNVMPDGKMVCPCHGSEFSSEGKVIKGPAKADLQELPVLWDDQQKAYYTEIILHG